MAAGVLVGDMLVRRKRLDTITAFYFGMIIGLFLTYVLQIALSPLLPTEPEWLADWLRLAMATVVCYSCISVLLQTKNDFRFIIPYVEFAKEIKGLKPYVLDTSVVIDGRIADVVETRVIDNQLIMPQFVVAELQTIADSSDRLRRGKRPAGLDILNRLRSTPKSISWSTIASCHSSPASRRPEARAAGQAPRRQGRHQRLQPQQSRQAARSGVINLNDLVQRAQAGLPAWRDARSADHQARRGSRARRWLSGRRHDGRHRRRPRPRQRKRRRQRDQRLQTSAGRMVFSRYERAANGQSSEADETRTSQVGTA